MKNYSSVLIIYNPNAMRGKIEEVLPRIKQRLLVRYPKVDTALCQSETAAEELAYKNASKYDIILSCGGDGTLHQVVNGVLKSGYKPVVGMLPFGTCNDVARSLKIPHDLDLAIDCVLRLNTTSYDVMFDGTDYYTYSLATGYLTQSSYEAKTKAKNKLGRRAYIFSALKHIFKFKALPITFTADGERIHDRFCYAMLLNGVSAGGFEINKNENLNNKKIKLVLIKGKGFGSFIAFTRLFMYGINKVKKNKHVIVKDVSSVTIENHSNETFTIDGEKLKFLKKTITVENSITMIKR